MPTITTETILNVHSCITCGVLYAFTAEYEAERRKDGRSFYCPSGHSAHYGDGPVERAHKAIEEAKRALTAEKCARANAEAAKAHALNDLTREREERAKEAEKTKRRHASGKCPCCQRSFASLARHIKHMHPEYCPPLKPTAT
jgi:hypothetical protein